MKYENILWDSLQETKAICDLLRSEHFSEKVAHAASLISDSFKDKRKLLLCGNGGSAAEAQHMAAEYVATLYSSNKRPGLAAVALTTDTSYLTAWVNDFGIETVFSRQIESLSVPGDTLCVYSTSGTSLNIVAAVETARSHGLKIIAFTGQNGGPLTHQVNEILDIPSNSTPKIQEFHTLLGHIICKQVELNLGY